MKRRAFLAVLPVGLVGCLEYLEDDEREDLTGGDDVEITYADLVRENPGTEEERVYVWGIVENTGERKLSYLEIRATFFDAEGEELDAVLENVQDVTTGEEWEFEIEFPHFGEEAARVESYELEVGTSV